MQSYISTATKYTLIILVSDYQLFVRDAKSSGGTYLNEVRLSPRGLESCQVQLKSGDILRLGDDCELGGGNNLLYSSSSYGYYFKNYVPKW